MPISRSDTGVCDECGRPGGLSYVPMSAGLSVGPCLLCPECLGVALEAATGLKFLGQIRYAIAQSAASEAVRAERIASGEGLTRRMRITIARKSR